LINPASPEITGLLRRSYTTQWDTILFAADIRRQRVLRMREFHRWRWHLDEVFVRINGERHYLWRAVDHECR
jgi:transposase-like protein